MIMRIRGAAVTALAATLVLTGATVAAAAGNGTAGNGTAGNGTAGNGTAGNGTAGNGIGSGKGFRLPSVDSHCSPRTDPARSGGPAITLIPRTIEVASGTIAGHTWSLRSARGKGQSGANGLENGGLVIDGRAYGLCPGFPNPAELEMADIGRQAIVYGVIGYPGQAKVQLYIGKAHSFTRGAALPAPSARVVRGVTFFIGTLPRPACRYPWLELNAAAKLGSSQHNLGFGACKAGQLVRITASMGIWIITA